MQQQETQHEVQDAMPQGPTRNGRVGLYLHPTAGRRVEFQNACGNQFARLYLAESVEQARLFLKQQPVDSLVISLEGFERSFDLFSLRELVAHRAGAPTLLICPFTHGGWLPELMAAGPVAYAIAPLLDDQLREAIAHHLDCPCPAATDVESARSLRSLLATTVRMQHAIAGVDDFGTMAAQICHALAGMPGVVHAALFRMRDIGDLQIEAQHADSGLNLARILGVAAHRNERLADSPMRHAFPGLLAAFSDEMALLDDPTKAGDPELALALVDAGVGMVLGLPLPASRAGVQRGSLCLMFERARRFSADEMACFVHLGQQAGFGLRMAEMNRDNELLQGRLAHQATTDTLTGVSNRRHGEFLLELEVRRARRYTVPLALLVFDIDRLKAVNDQFGHLVGDAAIRTVAGVVLAELRASDVLVRSGGGEFHIIAPHTCAIDALKIAEKIRVAIAAADIPGCDHVTVSFGVGQLTEAEPPDHLVVRINSALARAKRSGRNCIELAMA